MENFVIGIALFLLLVMGYYGLRLAARKAGWVLFKSPGLQREEGPPPSGPDPGSFSWRLGRKSAGKTKSAVAEMSSVPLDSLEPATPKKTVVPPPPSGQ